MSSLEATLERVCQATVRIDRADGSHGSGFFVARDLVVTCWHVMRRAARVRLGLDNPKSPLLVATLVGADRGADFALLHCSGPGSQASPLLLRPKAVPPRGKRIYAVGTPLQTRLLNSVTDGVVSSVREKARPWKRLQFSAATYSGSSGSPLVDESGAVVGMVTSGVRGLAGEEAANIGLATPVCALAEALEHSREGAGDEVLCLYCGAGSHHRVYCEHCGRDRPGRYLLLRDGRLECRVCHRRAAAERVYCEGCGIDFDEQEERI